MAPIHGWCYCKCCNPFGNPIWQFLKTLNIELPYDTNPIPRYISKTSENICLHKSEYINMFTAALFIIAKNLKLPITWWTDKQNSIHPYNGLALSAERNQSLIHEWILKHDEPWKHYSRWKNINKTWHIIWLILFTKVFIIEKFLELESDWKSSKGWRRGELEVVLMCSGIILLF